MKGQYNRSVLFLQWTFSGDSPQNFSFQLIFWKNRSQLSFLFLSFQTTTGVLLSLLDNWAVPWIKRRDQTSVHVEVYHASWHKKWDYEQNLYKCTWKHKYWIKYSKKAKQKLTIRPVILCITINLKNNFITDRCAKSESGIRRVV